LGYNKNAALKATEGKSSRQKKKTKEKDDIPQAKKKSPMKRLHLSLET
jgi:hypothetical protein